ncbi:hypothetical protein WP3W18E02_24160 [Klebsiella sp. WP3-W18-ESBL-02]|nr:hypothetical protein WP3W18E02_24160 [Klebsiella sp. WP3-W18-ESBL-02]BBR20888.1 hypothetical protein WP3S18E05_23680 [Klebsiella sp. WP3-S18-ESBL-05]
MYRGAACPAPVSVERTAYQPSARTSDRSQAVANSEMNRMMLTAVSIRFSILILLMSVQPLNRENLNDLFCILALQPNTITYVIICGDEFIIKLTGRIMNTRMPVETRPFLFFGFI